MSSTSSFCSTPDALGFDGSEKGIFDSLKNIAQLPPSPLKEGGREADCAAGMAEKSGHRGGGQEFPCYRHW